MTDTLDTVEKLQGAYDGSYYFIAGCGGDLDEWITGYEDLLAKEDIGKPTAWFQTTGALINDFAGASYLRNENSPYPPDMTCLLFPLDGLDMARLAIFKIKMENRWFDDVIQNMRRH